ncbi:hypothetical protein BDV3_001058 [Batrachochytrium dendrobatidis]
MIDTEEADVYINSRNEWYTDAASYWEQIEPTVQGMLGGFGFLTHIDAKGSSSFISEFVASDTDSPPRLDTKKAYCGAGIGRVSETFLLKTFDRVDLVEQNAQFLNTAKANFKENGLDNRVDAYIPLGLQEFSPEEGQYDLIWCQWVLGHLKDDDLVSFFQRCKKGLKPNGMIGVKENIAHQGILIDKEDSSMTRCEEILVEIMHRAGLTIVKQETQSGFPKELFAVKM